MTINYARESVIDFTKPFMNLGISILFKVRLILEALFKGKKKFVSCYEHRVNELKKEAPIFRETKFWSLFTGN